MLLVDKILNSGMRGRRLAAFVASAFAGMFIIMGAVMLLIDISSIWAKEDSFLNTDYIVLNHKAGAGVSRTPFTAEELRDLEAQPWVRRVGPFRSADYRVAATVDLGGQSFSSLLFFESVPDEFLDIPAKDWRYTPGSGEVPVILSKSYLTLYNFGFAGSVGTPQISEQLLTSIPLTLELTANDGSGYVKRPARVVALSNRLNTILVPDEFLKETNALLGSGEGAGPGRVIVDVSSPGDTAIKSYLKEHGLESAADTDNSAATFLLRVISGVAAGVGLLITVLSIVILTLSVSLLLERNRERIRRLGMLGYRNRTLARPFRRMILKAVCGSWIGGCVCLGVLMACYSKPLTELGGRLGGFVPAAIVGGIIAAVIYLFGTRTVRREIRSNL